MGGGNFAPSLLIISLESFYKFLHQLVQMDFIFHCVYLGFRKQHIQRCAHYKKGEFLHHHCWAFHLRVSASFCKFLQVLTSTHSSGFYILPLAFDFQFVGVTWEFLQVPTSSFLNSLVHLWLSTPMLFKNFAFISFRSCCCVKVFASSCADHQSQSHC